MKFLQHWRIKTRLTLLAVLAALATAGIGLHGLYGLSATNRQFKSTFEDRVVPLTELKTVADMYAVNIVDTAHKVRNGNLDWAAGLRNIDEAQDKIARQWRAYVGTYLTEEEKTLVSTAETRIGQANVAVAALRTILQGRDARALAEYTATSLYPAIDPVSASISALVDLQLAEARRAYESAVRDYERTRIVVIVWIALSVAVCSLLSAGVIRAIAASLNDATGLARRIAAGDLTSAVPPSGRNEIGALMLALGDMQAQLRRMIGGIIQGAGAISGCATRLSSASEHVASGSRDQSDAASAMAAAVEQMTVSIGHVAANASEAHASAKESGDSAREGGQIVMCAAGEMNIIADSVQASAGIVQTLGEHSARIANVVDVIKDVADQTNLLALNAAIEAARAGDMGRGFSVVADEVRKLAERTTTSTHEIASMIDAIRGDTARAVEGMRKGSSLVADGLEMARMAGTSIQGITAGTDLLINAIGEISDSIQEQRVASEQIAQNVERIALMAEENSCAIAEVAGTARNMEGLAQNLRSAVSHFSI